MVAEDYPSPDDVKDPLFSLRGGNEALACSSLPINRAVKLAVHKKTGQNAAIKIMGKKDIKSIEMYQIKKEIEVMKMSKHPNVVKLIDIFESDSECRV